MSMSCKAAAMCFSMMFTPTSCLVWSNAYVESPGGTYVKWMSGKFNVPTVPVYNTAGTNLGAFGLWPGLDPWETDCGLIQQVLQVANTHGRWAMTNMVGQHGHYPASPWKYVSDGDTVSWWTRYMGGMIYEMGWNNGKTGAVLNVTCTTRLPRRADLAVVELSDALAARPEYLPRSDWRMWDVVIQDNYGRAVRGNQQCNQGRIPLSCDWNRMSFTFHFARVASHVQIDSVAANNTEVDGGTEEFASNGVQYVV